MIDTGSEASLIMEEFLITNPELNKRIIKIPKITLVGANNKKLYEVNKMMYIEINISSVIVSLQLLVVPNLDVVIVLGHDELSKQSHYRL